ncbi:cysteine desulfurase family protein [Haloferula sp. A504]|uniref:cysteine desulfurase family protein n=1 Tax=Haloferula sp. A504 TaxID=3373601 RepID=UPI0031C96113|nr:aminotransferase class V-fold PLP-dependent enzyme [Verrucomicrobiaceae bacterium E54]
MRLKERCRLIEPSTPVEEWEGLLGRHPGLRWVPTSAALRAAVLSDVSMSAFGLAPLTPCELGFAQGTGLSGQLDGPLIGAEGDVFHRTNVVRTASLSKLGGGQEVGRWWESIRRRPILPEKFPPDPETSLGNGENLGSDLRVIYLDHNATTPVLPKVVDAMLPWLRENWGNPSSIYGLGRLSRRAVEEARAKVAALVGALPEQVVFTSGATEGNNSTLHSAVFRDPSKRHVVTSAVEHSAVLAYCDYLEQTHGIEVTRLHVDSGGGLDLESLRRSIRPDTTLVSLMWANNETGVIWPIRELAAIAADAGVPVHTDAVQAVAKIPVSFEDAPIDFLTLSGHKFGAPKGVGALVVREPEKFVPLIHGGKQEHSLRGGTENVSQIVGLGAAAELVSSAGLDPWARIAAERDQFERQVLASFAGADINGCASSRLPNTSNVFLPGMDGDALVTFLDQQGICVSSGAACLESAITPSHVLLAISGSHDLANESIRVSLGQESTEDDLRQLIAALETFAELNS